MKPSFAIFAVVFAASGALAQSLTINTPANAVVCQPLQIQWSGGQAPYFLSIHPGASPNGPALLDFGQQNSTSLVWLVNIAAGTQIDLTISDITGTSQQSAPFTINSGTSTNCVSQPVSTSAGSPVAGNTSPATGGSSAAAPTPTSPGSTTGAAPTTGASVASAVTTKPGSTQSSGSTSKPASSGSSSGGAAAPSTSNAALVHGAGLGTAAALGAVALALLA